MSDLFMRRDAVFSVDRAHRLELTRVWDRALPMLVVCMLNPSTADHEVEDPTLLALIHFGKLWGYGGLRIVNLYSLRTSKPAEMFAALDRATHVDNERYRAEATFYARDHGGRMLAAWGNGGAVRATFFSAWAVQHVDLVCLGTTLSGAPKHPMARGQHRIPRDQMPMVWRARS
jgi:hypothetical protein